jgi:hypothetical protein
VVILLAEYFFPHMKFLERGWNEYDDWKDSACEKIMMRTGIYVPRCVEKSWYWENTIAGMVHTKYRNMKCNYHNAVRKEFWGKYIIMQTLFLGKFKTI